jgi:ketosteroid isomerase-like protein
MESGNSFRDTWPVAPQDVELVLQGIRAFGDGDRTVLKNGIHPEAEWHPALGALTQRSVYRGKDAVCELLLDELPSILDDLQAEVLAVEDLDDAVLVKVSLRGRAKRAEIEVEQIFFQLYRVRDGLVSEMRPFRSRDEAVEAAGPR